MFYKNMGEVILSGEPFHFFWSVITIIAIPKREGIRSVSEFMDIVVVRLKAEAFS